MTFRLLKRGGFMSFYLEMPFNYLQQVGNQDTNREPRYATKSTYVYI